MEGRTSIRHLLLAAVAMFVLSDVGYADQVTIQAGQGANIFLFQNAHPTATATDFRVVLLSQPQPAIGGGTGGPLFPDPHFEVGAAGGGFLRVIYDGGAGVPAGLIYAHSFPDWPVGTRFNVFFSYTIAGQIELLDAKVVGQGTATAQGKTTSTPEPITMLLLGTGLAGVAIKTRKRLKSRKSSKGRQ